MKISVLIPTYKAANTIVSSVKSVLAQTLEPHEIIVLLDGEMDDTVSRLRPFAPRLQIVVQENQGVACARNRLVQLASGDVAAFLDSDDLWHPDYLRAQQRVFERFPNAVASYAGHVRFRGRDYVWKPESSSRAEPQLLDPVTFFSQYNIETAIFGSMSYCCIRKPAIERIGTDPFSTDLHAVEDSYFAYRLALLGPVAFLPDKLVAYRLVDGSLSENRVRNLGRWVTAFERLERQYHSQPSLPLARAHARFYASKRREYAKILMGVGRVEEAREELIRSISNCSQPLSKMKSLALLASSRLPKSLQPKWPSSVRVVTTPTLHP
jgi:glycosyltransferase involved in cell wall biosynthesis